MAEAQYVVAMCDVLGFSNLIRTQPLDLILTRYRSLREQARAFQMQGYTPGIAQAINVVDCVIFSDTVLFWAPATGAPDVLPMLLCFLVAKTLAEMPLRIGIACGSCVIDPVNDIFIGVPIVDAYETESMQEWVGGAYHDSCEQLPGFLEWLCNKGTAVQYPVPVKPSTPRQLRYALNWPLCASAFGNVQSTLRQREEEAEQPAQKRKWREAQQFSASHPA